MRLGSFSRFHASSGGKAKLDGSASRSISSSSQAPRPVLLQLLDHPREDGGEMRDVGDGIIDLALVERTAAPVGEARALIEAVAKQALDQIRIADLLAMPERHRRDLRVEQRVGHLAGEIMDDFEILAAGVEDLQHVLVSDEEVEQRLQVDPSAFGSIAAASSLLATWIRQRSGQ